MEGSADVHVPVGADVRNVGVLGVEEDVNLDAVAESRYLETNITQDVAYIRIVKRIVNKNRGNDYKQVSQSPVKDVRSGDDDIISMFEKVYKFTDNSLYDPIYPVYIDAITFL